MAELDPCPHCGEGDWGNAGARAQHVKSCGKEAEKYAQTRQLETQTVEPVEPNNTPPAQNAPQDENALQQAGETVSSSLSAALDENAPTEQKKAGVKQLTSLIGGVVSGVVDYRDQKEEMEKQRARNANVEPTDDKPSCECGLTFTRIPQNVDRIACPECGREYRVQ